MRIAIILLSSLFVLCNPVGPGGNSENPLHGEWRENAQSPYFWRFFEDGKLEYILETEGNLESGTFIQESLDSTTIIIDGNPNRILCHIDDSTRLHIISQVLVKTIDY